jgi:hypothetical protein
VLRFVADPSVVEPFVTTALSWQVDIPPGCPIALTVAGQRVGRTGTVEVTPLHVDSRFGLVASMLGVRGTLASAQVTVDQSTCRDQVLPESLIAPRVEAAIDEFDEEDDDFRQIEPPQIQVQANGLLIQVMVKADITAFPDATVTLDMGLRFTVRGGVIEPRYTLFRPDADTALPDDFVESKFFDRADSILADFRQGFNEGIAEIVADDEQLFDLVTEPFGLRATSCAIEPPPEPQLTVRLRVLPAGDPGRFNLRIDGSARATNQGDGGSTGMVTVSGGRHIVSQTAAAPTNLSDYRTFIGGDCGQDGRVTLAPGDVKICFITNLAQESPDQCQEDCRQEREICRDDPASTPALCVALFKACIATCN